MARRTCRYCGHSLIHIWDSLYECSLNKCDTKYLSENFHGKMIDMTPNMNKFRNTISTIWDVIVEDDALAYAIYKTSVDDFVKFVKEINQLFGFIIIEFPAGPRGIAEEPCLVISAKSSKTRVEFNKQVRKFMASLRKQGSQLYSTTAILHF